MQSPLHQSDEGESASATVHAGSRRLPTLFVHLAHALDALIGLACIVYGALIAAHFEEPATEAVAALLTYGSVLLAASAMGTAGLRSARCERVGLAVSQNTGPFVACLYAVAVGLGIGSKPSDLNYLRDKKDVLYLTDAMIDGLNRFFPLVYTLLALLAAMEIAKSFVIHDLRKEMGRLDSVKLSKRRSARNLTERLLDGSETDAVVPL